MVMNICEVCGEEFETSRPAKYCSEDCKKEANMKARNARRRASRKVSKVCPICGNEFKGTSKDKYCSDDCVKLAEARLERGRHFERVRSSVDTAYSIQEDNPDFQWEIGRHGELLQSYGTKDCESEAHKVMSNWAKYAKMEEDIKSSNHH